MKILGRLFKSESPLELASQLMGEARAGNTDAVKTLVGKILAAAPTNEEAFQELVKEGLSKEEILEVISTTGLSHKAIAEPLSIGLFEAAAEGHLEIVRLLADHGATIDRQHAVDGNTALSIAAFMGHDEIVQFLVWRAANVNIPNDEGVTPFMLAVGKCSPETVLKMIDAYADLHSETKDGLTVKDFASMPLRSDVVEILESARESGVNTSGRELGLTAPAAKGGIRVATYNIGSYIMTVFSDVRALGPTQFMYVCEVSSRGTGIPVFYITCELSGASQLVMGIFDSEGHRNLGPMDDIGELRMFIARARLEAGKCIIGG